MSYFRKYTTFTAMVFFLIITFICQPDVSADEPIRVFVNESEVEFTQPPIEENGNTLVQLRPIYERLGIAIQWEEETQTITSLFNDFKIVMTVESTDATLDGKPVKVSIAPRIVNGSTFIPLRFVAESLHGEVTWDGKANRVDILIDGGYYVDLYTAKNDLEKVKAWLAQHGNSNYLDKNDGHTPLSVAINHKNYEIAEQLLIFGANPNHSLSKSDSSTPLEFAVLQKAPALVQLLVDYGADVFYQGKEGSALDLAKKKLQIENVKGDKTRLEQIVSILEITIQKNTSLLSDDYALIPINAGAEVNMFKGEFGTWGYLDDSGVVAVKPKFSLAFPFSEGLAYAITKDGHQAGYIDKTGKFRFTFDFEPPLYSGDFKEGLAPVNKDDKWGFIDKTGAFVIPPKYEWANSFSEGLAAVKQSQEWGLINRLGEVVVEPKYEWIFPFQDGLALVRGEQSGFINTHGELVLDFQTMGISEFGGFSEGYAAVKQHGMIGFVDTKGEFVIPPQYTYAGSFHEGLSFVSPDHQKGIADTTGHLVVPVQFDSTFPFRNGQALVKKDKQWRFINTKGEMIGTDTFDFVDNVMGVALYDSIWLPFSDRANGMAMLHKEKRVYYVFPNGKVVEYIKGGS